MVLIVVVGVPGVGKTSVVSIAKDTGWEIVNYGDVMFEIASKAYSLKNRDEMRQKVPVEEYPKLQLLAAKRIASMAREKPVILDTHASVLKPDGYYPGLPFEVLKILKPRAFVIIEADPEEILKRREKDKELRKREGDPAEHQEINRYLVAAYSAITGASIKIIKNKEGKLEEAREEFLKFLKLFY